MMNMKLFRYALALSIGLVMASWSLSSGAAHAIALFGEPKYPAQFSHFEYANPNAPKGGTLNLATVSLNSNFDKYNPFTMKGIVAPRQRAGGRRLIEGDER